MPPKKATTKKTAPAPTPARRSARLASREPSNEPAEAPAVVEKETGLYPSSPLDDLSFVGPRPDYSHAGTVSQVRKPQQKKKKTESARAAGARAPERAVDAAVLRAAGAIEKILCPGTHRGNFVRGLTSDERAAVILGLAEQNDGLVEEVGELKKQLAVSRGSAKPSLRRDFGLAAIHAAFEEKKRMGLLPEQQDEVRSLPPSLLPHPLTQTKEKKAEAAPPAQQPRSAPSTPPAAMGSARQALPPATAPHASVLSRVFSTFGGYLASPFARKRSAEAAEEEPMQKRARTEEVTVEATPHPTEDSPREEQLALPAPPQPSPPKSGLHVKRAAESHDEDDGSSRPAKRARGPEPQQTPPSVRQQHDRARDFTGPSSKNPQVPTSLSTITEYTEPSSIIDAPDTTPSKPSRAAPSHQLKAPQNTPATAKRAYDSISEEPDSTTPTVPPSAFSASSTSIYQSTPTHQPNMMRRSAQLRAARIAQANTPTPRRPYAWERNSATAKPREPNADARLAKIQRIRDLERQLSELKEDVEVQEIESHSVHRRKRVKIDDLASIPHNRPGDSAGTFRVPEPDSDDEIEVEDSMDVDSTIFEEGEKSAVPTSQAAKVTESSSTPQITTPTPVQASKTGNSAAAAPQAPKTSGFSIPSASVSTPKPASTLKPASTPAAAPAFAFPNVGSKTQTDAQTPKAPVTGFPSVGSSAKTDTQTPKASAFGFPNVGSNNQTDVQTPKAPAFELDLNFPNVGLKPNDYYCSPEEKAEAGRAFGESFNKFLIANGHI